MVPSSFGTVVVLCGADGDIGCAFVLITRCTCRAVGSRDRPTAGVPYMDSYVLCLA